MSIFRVLPTAYAYASIDRRMDEYPLARNLLLEAPMAQTNAVPLPVLGSELDKYLEQLLENPINAALPTKLEAYKSFDYLRKLRFVDTVFRRIGQANDRHLLIVLVHLLPDLQLQKEKARWERDILHLALQQLLSDLVSKPWTWDSIRTSYEAIEIFERGH